MILSILGVIFGVIFAFVWKAKDYIQHKMFSFPIWWQENKVRFIWSMSFALIFGLMINLYPDSIDALEFVGFNMSNEDDSLSEVLIGLFICYATYSKSKTKEQLMAK